MNCLKPQYTEHNNDVISHIHITMEWKTLENIENSDSFQPKMI